MPKGYSRAQIALHWGVALFVLAQFLNDGAIGQAWRAFRRAQPIPDSTLATLHVWVGVTILALVLWRIALRVLRGAPRPPETEPRPLRLLASATHGLLYLTLLTVAVAGASAWFLGSGAAAEVHELATTLLMWLVFLHVAGALYQRFVLRSDVLTRMLRPEA